MVILWEIYGKSMGNLRGFFPSVRKNSIFNTKKRHLKKISIFCVRLWFFYGFSMVFLWFFYVFSMFFLCFFYGFSMVFLWFFYGFSMVLRLWEIVESRCIGVYGFSMVSHRVYFVYICITTCSWEYSPEYGSAQKL